MKKPEKNLRQLYQDYRSAMAFVGVMDQEGRHNIGSAFHVGEGVFVTARHVVERARITGVGLSECCAPPVPVVPDVLFHPDPTVDVAALYVPNFDWTVPAVPLGGHLDDWIADQQWVLSRAIILGYPPIPFTKTPQLVVTSAEVNCVADLWSGRHPLFIMSATPRGGFSGGLVLSEMGFVLGMVTESLVRDGAPVESGFFGALTVEPIYNCLAFHKRLPKAQKKGWGDAWDVRTQRFGDRTPEGGIMVRASVEGHDDGEQFSLVVHSQEERLRQVASESVARAVAYPRSVSTVGDNEVRFELSSAKEVVCAAEAAAAALRELGLHSND